MQGARLTLDRSIVWMFSERENVLYKLLQLKEGKITCDTLEFENVLPRLILDDMFVLDKSTTRELFFVPLNAYDSPVIFIPS